MILIQTELNIFALLNKGITENRIFSVKSSLFLTQQYGIRCVLMM